ncbi:hypothetical protein BBJ28_00003544 [Nothophytophthora sp. Chile5]|nr:hypothetical protein BBJ28_00003544 [Nothophytophthora sp. Chile5]
MPDWGACTGNLKCQSPTSVCVRYSQWYSQCKPATLPQGELCGQNDGTNVWKYDHCPSGQVCSSVGTDFRCKNKKHHKEHHKAGGPSDVADWGACTGGLKCQNPTSACVYYNQWYSQCTPGASNGVDDWGACTGGLKCKTSTSTCVYYNQWYSQCTPGASSGIDDWGACTGNLKCKTSTSVCVRYSQWYSQCKPATLPQGELCGQNDGTNVWKYDHCPSGQTCKANGSDFRCKNKKHHKEHDKDSSCTITNESQCDGQNCVCVEHSQYYSQCKPATLPSGQLCGQDDGTNVWFYDHCPSEETCEANGSDFRCTKA